jgi:hypothetical protein
MAKTRRWRVGAAKAHGRRFALQLVTVRWPRMVLADPLAEPGAGILAPPAASPGYRPVSVGSWAGRWLPASRSPPSEATQRSGPAAASGAAPLVSRMHSHMDTCSWWAILTARIIIRPASQP